MLCSILTNTFSIVHHYLMIVSLVDRPNRGLPTTKESFSYDTKKARTDENKIENPAFIRITPPHFTWRVTVM